MRLSETQLRYAIRTLLMTELFVSPKKKREKKLGMGANIKRVLDREPRSPFFFTRYSMMRVSYQYSNQSTFVSELR